MRETKRKFHRAGRIMPDTDSTQPHAREAPADEAAAIPAEKRRRSMRYSVADGCFYASMVGFGETYFIPLLIAVGATTFQIGAFASAPQLFLAFAQFLGIALVERLRVRKRIIVGAVVVQTAILFWMFMTVAQGTSSPWLLVLFGIGYFSVNGVVLPAWNSLIGDLTTERNRGAYLGFRNGLSQLVLFASMAAAGLILEWFDNTGAARMGFAVILGLAVASRVGSTLALAGHFEAPYNPPQGAYFSFWSFLRRSGRSNFAHFVYFVSLMTFAVQMAAPFFTVYMLRDLGFSYMQFMIAQGVFIGSQFLAMHRWGAFADRFGNRAAMRICTAISPWIPLLWFLSTDYIYILAIQVLAGLAWAGWFLASNNFIFDAVTPPKRARCAAYFNFFNGIGFFLGAMFGAWLSARAPATLSTGALTVTFLSPLQFIFLVSSAMRFVVVFFFLPTVREVRPVGEPRFRDMFLVFRGVRPFGGVSFHPFTGVGRSESGALRERVRGFTTRNNHRDPGAPQGAGRDPD
jgi:MFS family permease